MVPSLSPAMAPTTITMKVDTAASQASPGKDISMSPKSRELLEEGSSVTTSNKLVTAMETPQEDNRVETEMLLQAIGRMEHIIAIQAAPPE